MAAACTIVPVHGSFFLNQLLVDELEPGEFNKAVKQCYQSASKLSERIGKAVTPEFLFKQCDGNVEVFLTNGGLEEKIYECRKQ